MFKITRGSGFHLKFPNGIILSTQIGPGTYSDNYNVRFDTNEESFSSNTAEIAILKNFYSLHCSIEEEEGRWLTEQCPFCLTEDCVEGHVDMEKWLKIFEWCKNYDKKDPLDQSL